MKTLTITDAKKNLGRLLSAAARGEDIGIISGADIIALRKVEIEAADYAFSEYGATEEDIQRLADGTRNRYRRMKKAAKLVTVRTPQELKKRIAQSADD